jgi:oligopeptide/dipeptide ABC transporter ATP-binding protein
MTTALQIRDLSVSFVTGDGTSVPAVMGIDLDVAPGRVLALVGESGSGKSASLLGTLGLLPRNTVSSGTAKLHGEDLLALPRRQLRRVRGRDVGVIFQDPISSLNPVMTVGAQVAEAIALHHPKLSRAEVRERACQALEEVGIPAARRRYGDYPHQFSGGMRQRVMIAMAIVNRPSVIVADEPTTALDVTVQAQILELLVRLCRERDAALVIVTHDLGVVAGIADEVAVMYAGRIVERAPVEDVFYQPAHPYTQGLLRAVPRLDLAGHEPEPIPGSPATAASAGPGCSFSPRCPLATEECHTDVPVLREIGRGHSAACVHAEHARSIRAGVIT